MVYATAADYAAYGDGSIPEGELEKALETASDQVDAMTYNRIAGRGLAVLTEYQQRQVKKAVCQQADFIQSYGAFVGFPLAGYSAGSVSVSFKSTVGPGGVQTTDAIQGLLQSTGLTNRGLC